MSSAVSYRPARIPVGVVLSSAVCLVVMSEKRIRA